MQYQKPREIAVDALRARSEGRGYLEDIVDDAFERCRLSPPDRGLAQELAYGVTRWQATLDWLIAAKTGGRTQKPLLQILLRLGLYQLFWLDRVPDHAAVFETVEMARRLGLGPQSGFLNAVLRGFSREREPTRLALTDLKKRQPALGYSHPAWLVERWTSRWGEARTVRLLEWNNTPSTDYARANTLRAPASQLLEQWRIENVDYDFPRWDWVPENAVFELKAHPKLAKLTTLNQGWFYVQDPSTLLAPLELGARPGEKVLDWCAAPGGKTTYLAQLMENQGVILAQETSPDRLRVLEANCKRMGTSCVRPVTPSALAAEGLQKSDRVLVDAPCSNTGVMRRRVDLRWRIEPSEIQRLRENQVEILKQASQHVRPGGTLVYSTCSLEPEENQQVVQQFLAQQQGFRLDHERQLLPFVDRADGAYVARLACAG